MSYFIIANNLTLEKPYAFNMITIRRMINVTKFETLFIRSTKLPSDRNYIKTQYAVTTTLL
jgi:hypothetical protein